MERSELEELHYITPIENLPSIMQRGLLSHHRAQRYNPLSVASAEIQQKRARKRVPLGRPLHHYVNLYICARNPMLYRLLKQGHRPCVLSVSTTVLDLDGVAVTGENAAADYPRFGNSLDIVDRERTFAEYWTHEDPAEQWRRKRMKCAEVLVPDRVDSAMIRGAYVCSVTAENNAKKCAPGLPVRIDRDLFFGYA